MMLPPEDIYHRHFKRRAHKRLQSMNQAVEDLRTALELPAEAKYELVSLFASSEVLRRLSYLEEGTEHEKKRMVQDTQTDNKQNPHQKALNPAPSRKKRPWLSMLAALLCASVLVGALTLTLQRARQTTVSLSNLYTATGDEIYHFTAQTGHLTPLWHYTLSAPWSTQLPGNANNPSPLWSLRIDSAPTVDGNRVYFGGNEDDTTTHQLHHYLYALDAAHGTLLWRYQIDGNNTGIKGPSVIGSSGSQKTSLDPGRLASAPQVADGLVYIQVDNQPVYYIQALDSKTGRLRWSYSYKETGAYSQMSGIMDGRLYVTVDNRLFALDAQSGQQQWIRQVPWQAGSSSFLDLQIANGAIYATFLSYPGHQDINNYSDTVHTSLVYAFDAASGNQRWVSQPIDGRISNLIADQHAVYFGSEAGHLYALDANNGSQLWSYGNNARFAFVYTQSTGSVLYARQTASLYGPAFGTYNGPPPHLGIVALDTKSGKLIWKQSIPETIPGSIGTAQGWDGGQLVAWDGILYTSLRNGLICSLAENNGAFLQCTTLKNPPGIDNAPVLTITN